LKSSRSSADHFIKRVYARTASCVKKRERKRFVFLGYVERREFERRPELNEEEVRTLVLRSRKARSVEILWVRRRLGIGKEAPGGSIIANHPATRSKRIEDAFTGSKREAGSKCTPIPRL